MKEAPSIGAGFFVVRPHRSREKGTELLNFLTSQGGIYIPEECEVWKEKEEFVRRKFSPEIMELLLDEWNGLHGPLKGFNFLRWHPFQVQFIADLKDFANYDIFSLHVQKSYLKEPGKLREFLDVGRRLYGILNPCFGDISSWQMRRKVREGGSYLRPGTNLVRQGLPDIYWANFLGPEYVELFGSAKVFSSPCYSVEKLSDGGALLILTETPFDFEENREAFDEKRDALRTHLGQDAFYRGDEGKATRFPEFRFWEEREAIRKEFESKHQEFFAKKKC